MLDEDRSLSPSRAQPVVTAAKTTTDARRATLLTNFCITFSFSERHDERRWVLLRQKRNRYARPARTRKWA
jgi:hypothetical protein